MKLRKNDEVKVTRGKDAGKTGKIIRVLGKEGKVVVEGVNQYKRHTKARTQGQKSEIVTITKPLPVANLLFLCPKCKEPARLGFTNVKGAKERICKKCGKSI